MNDNSQSGQQSAKSTNRGFRPLQEGYSPLEKRGHTANTDSGRLPKAPRGGTGQVPVASSSHNEAASSPKKG
jgi:hypothetical protein